MADSSLWSRRERVDVARFLGVVGRPQGDDGWLPLQTDRVKTKTKEQLQVCVCALCAVCALFV